MQHPPSQQQLPPGLLDMYEKPFSLFDDSVRGAGAGANMQRSTHVQQTEVSARFFSQDNIDRLQGLLRQAVREATGYAIDRQSQEQLLIVMRYVYMQNSLHVGGEREVRRLNALVLRETVPQVAAGLAQYLDYLRDASTMPVPIARGQATSIKGTKTTELFRGL